MKDFKTFMEQYTPKDFSPPPIRYLPHIRTPAVKELEMMHYNRFIKNLPRGYLGKKKTNKNIKTA
tara:strand:+ start:313 stop:507 length:195 start_codon:yes stop_codon:yes gene_type:complete